MCLWCLYITEIPFCIFLKNSRMFMFDGILPKMNSRKQCINGIHFPDIASDMLIGAENWFTLLSRVQSHFGSGLFTQKSPRCSGSFDHLKWNKRKRSRRTKRRIRWQCSLSTDTVHLMYYRIEDNVSSVFRCRCRLRCWIFFVVVLFCFACSFYFVTIPQYK